MRQRDQLLTEGIWKTLTAAAKKSRKPAYAAVAYFGQGASKLLPLPPNSRLVVDASDHAVKSGQTCPADLKLLQKRGVIIYSAPNLHAKVYAFNDVAFIGSANVSGRSAGTLIEAMMRTTNRSVIGAARSFVRDLCLNELSPGAIDRLGRIYRPPQMQGNIPTKRGRSVNRRIRQELPRLFLTHLVRGDLPAESEATEERGFRIARSRRKHGRTYVLDDFSWSGDAPFRERDKIIQVIKEKDGTRLIDAPGEVIHTQEWRRNDRRLTFVYLELPRVRRIGLERLARRLGYGAKKKLLKRGLVRDRDFTEALLADWSPKS
ncbi:MAG: phospholipase D family protein [Hyphomicrobiales bacterium]